MAMKNPGTMPPRNSPAIETLPMAPYTTAMIDGGTSAAMVEAAAIRAAVNSGRYPSFAIGPAMVRDNTATSADDEPDMPEKNIEKTVVTCASPPRMCPTSACDSSAIRITTLAEVINSPTSRKNGIAIRASESIPLNNWATIDCMVMGVNIVPTRTPANSENATGTPR